MQPNFNPHNIMMGGNHFNMTSDAQLLEQLRYMSAYGGHNQTTLILLHELHLRAAQAFGKTFVPTKEVQDDSFLYTSIFKDGVMTHFFVLDEETKSQIDEIFERTKVKDALVEGEFGAERIGLLMELGFVFSAISVNEHGKQIGSAKRCGFAALFGSKGFNEEPRHSSKVLPLGVIEVSTLALLNTDPKYFASQVLNNARQIINDREKLERLDGYLSSTSVLREYGAAVTEILSKKNSGIGPSLPTQIHLFPADGSTPAKFLGGLSDNWNAGFIKREQYPHLFAQPEGFIRPNGSGVLVGGTNGFGPAGGGPWY